MMIFLDTDTLSYFFTGNITIHDRISESIKSNHQICLTSINVYEVIKGLRYRRNSNKEKAFHSFLTDVTVFSLDSKAIQIAADIYATLRKNGTPIGDADILIASIVIANNGKLITNNIKHYQNIANLTIENWC